MASACSCAGQATGKRHPEHTNHRREDYGWADGAGQLTYLSLSYQWLAREAGHFQMYMCVPHTYYGSKGGRGGGGGGGGGVISTRRLIGR